MLTVVEFHQHADADTDIDIHVDETDADTDIDIHADAYLQKTGDAGDIITANFLDFPPNFRLRTRF